MRYAGQSKHGCTHPMRACGELRVYSERSNRWETFCPICSSVNSKHAIAARKAAAIVELMGGGSAIHPAPAATATCEPTAPSLHPIRDYAGVTLEEDAFVTRLLAAIKSDPVLMAAWESEKDDLFACYNLLCCRRTTKTDSLAKNVEAMHEHLRARIKLNFCGVRDEIMLNDRSIKELPMCACRDESQADQPTPQCYDDPSRSLGYLCP